MSNKSRIDQLVRHLCPKHLVISDIRESRHRYKSLVEYATATAKAGIPSPTLLEQIESSVTAAAAGTDRRTRIQMVRSAQQEGLFLARLAQHCETSVSESKHELELMTALLSMHVLVFIRSDELAEEAVTGWRTVAAKHTAQMLELRAAVKLVETEYLDGTPVLFRDSQEFLEKAIGDMSRLMGVFNGLARTVVSGEEDAEGLSAVEVAELNRQFAELRFGPAPTEEQLQPAARRKARRWVSLTKARVLDDFGETCLATAIATELVLDEDE